MPTQRLEHFPSDAIVTLDLNVEQNLNQLYLSQTEKALVFAEENRLDRKTP